MESHNKMIFYEPVNLKQWNMFEKVPGPGHVEPFLATNEMSLDDMILLHVGSQDKRYASGVYAIGKVVRSPYILTDHPADYCNMKNTVDVEITRIVRETPLITHDECKKYIRQFRTVHKINEIWYEEILEKIRRI